MSLRFLLFNFEINLFLIDKTNKVKTFYKTTTLSLITFVNKKLFLFEKLKTNDSKKFAISY